MFPEPREREDLPERERKAFAMDSGWGPK